MNVSSGGHPGPTAYYVKYRPVFEAAPPGAPVSPDFAGQQLAYALGANPWGTSFVVGAGTTFPHCMQSEIANLTGSLSGTGDIQVGATVDGPSSPGNFCPGARSAPPGRSRPLRPAADYDPAGPGPPYSSPMLSDWP
jgi:endoglucanase